MSSRFRSFFSYSHTFLVLIALTAFFRLPAESIFHPLTDANGRRLIVPPATGFSVVTDFAFEGQSLESLRNSAIEPGTAAQYRHISKFGSWRANQKLKKVRSSWFNVVAGFALIVTGLPNRADSSLTIEFEMPDGSLVLLPYNGYNPVGRWIVWRPDTPENAKRFRIIARLGPDSEIALVFLPKLGTAHNSPSHCPRILARPPKTPHPA